MLRFPFAIFLLLACFSSITAATINDFPYYKEALIQSNPNELMYMASIDKGCGISESELNALSEGVIKRSRVKPVKVEPGLHLNIRVNCFETTGQNLVYNVSVNFSEFGEGYYFHHVVDYGYLGVGRGRDILSATKAQIEKAMTDYITANFDL